MPAVQGGKPASSGLVATAFAQEDVSAKLRGDQVADQALQRPRSPSSGQLRQGESGAACLYGFSQAVHSAERHSHRRSNWRHDPALVKRPIHHAGRKPFRNGVRVRWKTVPAARFLNGRNRIYSKTCVTPLDGSSASRRTNGADVALRPARRSQRLEQSASIHGRGTPISRSSNSPPSSSRCDHYTSMELSRTVGAHPAISPDRDDNKPPSDFPSDRSPSCLLLRSANILYMGINFRQQ